MSIFEYSLQIHLNIFVSSDSKKERERMLSMKNDFVKLNKERQEVYDCLLKETANVERQQQSNGRCLHVIALFFCGQDERFF